MWSEDLIVNQFIIQSDAATLDYTNQVAWILRYRYVLFIAWKFCNSLTFYGPNSFHTKKIQVQKDMRVRIIDLDEQSPSILKLESIWTT